VFAVPSLFVIRGIDQGSKFELRTPSVTVGREPGNTIQLHDTEISRRHAELRLIDGRYMLVDLNSSNGTYLNGRRVEMSELTNGDQLQVGASVLLFTGAPDETTGAAAREVDIVPGRVEEDHSRILRSMTQEEGSRIFDLALDVPGSPWVARVRANLQVMYRTALAVSQTLDIEQLLARIMELIFEWVEPDRGCIMLYNAEAHQLEPKVRRNRQGLAPDDRMSISRTILDYVIQQREGVLTSDAQDDSRWDNAASIMKAGIREAICVPMQGRYDIVGVIYIDTSVPPRQVLRSINGSKFSEEHLKLMVAIGHQAALAVEDTRYYSAMVQAERLAAVGQTIATLSHHIKNILQGIRGGSYLIEMGLNDHDEAMTRKGWNIVDRNQNRISALVMDMLTFSKDREPELAPAELNTVVGDVVELMTARAGELGVTLRFEPGDQLPTLTFDSEGIHRAALNVVTNAIDACDKRDDGLVTVRTEYTVADRMARIIVSDNGSGIAQDQIENIFTLFVSHKGGRGTGLGLPVSQKIVKEHGGRILCESKVGEGSHFTLEFPAAPPRAASVGATLSTTAPPIDGDEWEENEAAGRT
jgi:two-component system NtrC family sensor kinase